MPISPENRKRYPADWKEISDRIRFERALGRCECTGECGTDHALDYPTYRPPEKRCDAIHGLEHPLTGSIVLLTVAHLDHTPEHCDDDNLRAMCQRCHNRYDAPHRLANRRRREFAGRANGDLFDQ